MLLHYIIFSWPPPSWPLTSLFMLRLQSCMKTESKVYNITQKLRTAVYNVILYHSNKKKNMHVTMATNYTCMCTLHVDDMEHK